jgi:hypothetical protein
LQSIALTERDSFISAITENLSDRPQDEFIAVYQNRMKRLRWAIENG